MSAGISVAIGPHVNEDFSMSQTGSVPNLGTLSELYHKHAKSLYWVCLRYTRNTEDAEDMVHQVFMKVQASKGSFRGQSNVYTWMYRIAVNECIQMFRKRKFEVDGGSFLDLETRYDDSLESELETKLLLERIMKTTDAETAEILFLLHLEGLKQEEVAETLKISRSTVNKKVAAFKIKIEMQQSVALTFSR